MKYTIIIERDAPIGHETKLRAVKGPLWARGSVSVPASWTREECEAAFASWMTHNMPAHTFIVRL